MFCPLCFADIEVQFRGEWLRVSDTPSLLPFCPNRDTFAAAVLVVASYLATLNNPTERNMSTPVATVEDDLWLSPDDEREGDVTVIPDSTMDFEEEVGAGAAPSPVAPPPPPEPFPVRPEARVVPNYAPPKPSTPPPPPPPTPRPREVVFVDRLAAPPVAAQPPREEEPVEDVESEPDDVDADPDFQPAGEAAEASGPDTPPGSPRRRAPRRAPRRRRPAADRPPLRETRFYDSKSIDRLLYTASFQSLSFTANCNVCSRCFSSARLPTPSTSNRRRASVQR